MNKYEKESNKEYIEKETVFSILRLVASLILLANAFYMFNSLIFTVIGSFISILTVIGLYGYMITYKSKFNGDIDDNVKSNKLD